MNYGKGRMGQAAAAGVLIDAGEVSREAGFTVPVLFTRPAWRDCVAWTDADTEATGEPQDQDGRLWDVLWMTSCAVRGARGSRKPLPVQLYRVSRDASEDQGAQLVTVMVTPVAQIDDAGGVMVLLVSLPEED